MARHGSADVVVGVAGGTGLVGRHIVEALVAAGHRRVRATSHRRPAFDLPGLTWKAADFLDPDDALEALRDVDVAVLCAGRLSTSPVLRADPMDSVLHTLRVGTNLLEAAARLEMKRVILVSSCTGYAGSGDPVVESEYESGDPPDPWFGVGWMHRYLEKQLQWLSVKLGLIGVAIVLRPTLVYGPHDAFEPASGHFVPSFVRKVVERETPIPVWGDGAQERNLIHASDLAAAVCAVLDLEVTGLATFNVAAARDSTVNEVLNELLALDGFADAKVVHEPARSNGPSSLRVSATALQAATGWSPKMALRDGLAGTLAWYRAQKARAAG